MNKVQLWRWGFYCTGMVVLAFGIAMTVKADRLGIAPWDVLHVGLYNMFGLTVGTWNIIVGASLLLIIWVWSRKPVALTTWLNIFIVGIFIDFFLYILPAQQSLEGNIMMFCTGVIIMGFGIGLYVAPDIGAGPRDTLMLFVHDKFGWGLRNVRTLLEVGAAVLGWLLGGPVGIGTVIMALTLGQIVHHTIRWCRSWLEQCICHAKRLKTE